MDIRKLEFEPGYFVITDDNGMKTRYNVASMLRAVDIPVLTHAQVSAVAAMANLTAILIRTLIARQVLDESFLEDDDMDLDHIIYAIEQMGGDYGDPDLSDAK